MSALNGLIEVGDIVHVVTYSPEAYDEPDGTRKVYITYPAMLVGGISENYDTNAYARSMRADDLMPENLVTRYWLRDPERPNDESKMIWVGSDRADLTHVVEDGAFF